MSSPIPPPPIGIPPPVLSLMPTGSPSDWTTSSIAERIDSGTLDRNLTNAPITPKMSAASGCSATAVAVRRS